MSIYWSSSLPRAKTPGRHSHIPFENQNCFFTGSESAGIAVSKFIDMHPGGINTSLFNLSLSAFFAIIRTQNLFFLLQKADKLSRSVVTVNCWT